MAKLADKSQAHGNLQQRTTFYCVPIPGESEWVKNMYKSQSCYVCNETSNLISGTKRGLENDELMETNQENQVQIPGQDVTLVCREKNTNYTICKVCYKSKVPDSNEETKTVTYTKKTKSEEVSENNINMNTKLT